MTQISTMTPLGSLPSSGAVVPVAKTGDPTPYNYDLAADLAGRTKAADLADNVTPAKGAALVKFNSALGYAAGTVGAFLNSLLASAGSSVIGFIQSGTGAAPQTLQGKLRNVSKQATEYDTFAHFAAAAAPAGFFSENGAIIQRAERLMLGGAMFNDCALPNVNQDWLTQFQIAAGLSNGALIDAQFAALNTGTTSETGAVGLLGAIQSKYFASAATDAIGTQSIVVNNHATLATPAWAFYGEAHKLTAAAGSTYFMEGDTRTLVDSVSPTPFQQGNVVGVQLGSGAGLSATGQFNASAAYQIVSNPMKWKVGINFLHDSLVDGLAIYLAAQASGAHRVQWANTGGHPAGAITSTAIGSSANNITFTDSGLQISGADGSAVAYFGTLASGANWLVFGGGATTIAPAVSAAGSDTNIDLALIPKGTGNVSFGTWTTATPTLNGYITIKDSGGTLRKLGTVA